MFAPATAEMNLTPDMLPLVERVRRRADELKMPFESALKQAFQLYLKETASAVVGTHGGENQLERG
jgi:hypothetical protein